MLDACVLIPAAPRDLLLRCAEAGLYRPLWCEEVLQEVERNLAGHGMMAAPKAQELVQIFRDVFPEAAVSGPIYEYSKTIAANHPKDRHVLAAAIASGAEIIVTDNLKDFPGEALTPFDIEALSADEFLSAFMTSIPRA